jgi:predicted nicotinamide N-methyase
VDIGTNSEEFLPNIKRKDCKSQKKNTNLLVLADHQFNDRWEGVADLCQALDDMMIIEKDDELFLGKSILELGFTTGIPSTLAMDSGANEISLHSWDKLTQDAYVKPTIRRNAIPKNMCKFSAGDLQTCLRSLGGKKFDVVLAPEYICDDEENFEQLHDILDAALAPNGLM